MSTSPSATPSIDRAITLVVQLTVRRARAREFEEFERAAARIMLEHGGALERRVVIRDHPTEDELREVHVVTFPHEGAFAAYRNDPALLALRPVREACVVSTEILVGEEPGQLSSEAAAEVLGLDHLYLTVRSLVVSEAFYDPLLVQTLGFRKNRFVLSGDDHVHYYNRQLGLVIRPAGPGTNRHDPRSPGLHHLCLRVEGAAEVDRAAAALTALGLAPSQPKLMPEYAPDYYATFLQDPDGIRLEITNFRTERKARMYLGLEPAPASARGA